MLNACAGCYSEDLPVIFISGQDGGVVLFVPFFTFHNISRSPSHSHTHLTPHLHMCATHALFLNPAPPLPHLHYLPHTTCIMQVAPTPTTLPPTTQCTTPSA